ncbi:MAG: thioredoxin domain-containing protein, partial [Candidatus Hydrogenedens sp.]
VVQMTGSGGWPLSVFLTPDLKPFFGGTYFPPYSVGQHPGFMDILRYIQQLWTQKREQLETTGANFVALIKSHLSLPAGQSEGHDYQQLIDRAVESLYQNFDKDNGGWGIEPKFPPNSILPFLLHYASIYNDVRAKEMVEKTLVLLAFSGLHDHLGGGFHRYCTDRIWHVPHFEKMLYDNAQLSNIYFQYTSHIKEPFINFVGKRTLNYIISELLKESEGFFSSQDADSEHEEGNFYVWEYDEIKHILEKDAEHFIKYFGIQREGNWQVFSMRDKEVVKGKNILDPKYTGIPYNNWKIFANQYFTLLPYISKLYSIRNGREKPLKDNKCITSWNALAISAGIKGTIFIQDKTYLMIVTKIAENFLYDYKKLGFLPHILHNPKIEGFIEDYALFINALLDIYETTLDDNWIENAIMLTERMIHQFWDKEGVGFYRTSQSTRNPYLASSKPILDYQEPSGNSASAMALSRLGFLVNSEYLDMAEQLCQGYYNWIQRAPEAFPAWLDTMLFLKHKPVECTIFSQGIKLLPSPILTKIYHSQYPYFVMKRNKDIAQELKGSIAMFCHKQTCSAPIYNLDDIIPTLRNLTKIKN